jgi:hypothetical protein
VTESLDGRRLALVSAAQQQWIAALTGWRFHRLWSTNWFHDRDTEVAKLREAYEKAVASSPYIPPVDDLTAEDAAGTMDQ